MKRPRTKQLGIAFAATVLLVAGCGSDDAAPPAGGGSIGATSDINPRPVEDLKDGGNLRLDLSEFPKNFNILHNDGNNVEYAELMRWTMPRSYEIDSAGKLTIDHNYFTDIALTNTNPQQVTYTINPAAVWSDGSPITWEDIASQANALSGRDKAFLIAINNGFDRVEKVDRGVDDRQAVVTFRQHYAEWRGQFSGNATLMPKSVTANPDAFNKSWIDGPNLAAGPFTVTAIDKAQNRITLGRNPKWWGQAPKLDTVTFTVLDAAARIPALQNNELDVVDRMNTLDEVKSARGTDGIAIRRAPGNEFSHTTFNGAPGALLADPKLRVAIVKGIDRKMITAALLNGMVDDPQPLNNHVYLAGQVGYQDNSIPFDPEQARKELDELGWKLNGDVREKDGKKLEIRDIFFDNQRRTQEAQIMQQNLAAIGVKLNLEVKPGNGFFTDVVIPGNFDMAQWSWIGDPFPLSSLPQIYAYNPDDTQGNYGRVGSPELNGLIEQAISELDEQKAIDLANQIDKAVFAEGHSTPLYQSPGNYAVRDTIANYGAPGLSTYDYTKVGFLK